MPSIEDGSHRPNHTLTSKTSRFAKPRHRLRKSIQSLPALPITYVNCCPRRARKEKRAGLHQTAAPVLRVTSFESSLLSSPQTQMSPSHTYHNPTRKSSARSPTNPAALPIALPAAPRALPSRAGPEVVWVCSFCRQFGLALQGNFKSKSFREIVFDVIPPMTNAAPSC